MTIQFCSDLHLEFVENKKFLSTNPIVPKAEILILGGDIVPFALLKQHTDFFRFVSKEFKHVYWLPGNHEYYGTDVTRRSGELKEKILDNVFLVNNTMVTHANLNLIFSTLWSKINPLNEWMIERSVNDFTQMRFGNYRFSGPSFNQLHEDCLSFLKTALPSKQEFKTVVATHHVPTFFNYPPKWKGSLLNEAFSVELYDFIDTSAADYWMYGHHHCNVPDFTIGKTQMITNQLGYVVQGEQVGFDSGKTILV